MVGRLELPFVNEWQQRLSRGERVLVSLSDAACGVIPAALNCNAKYSLTLHQTDGRWCEDARLVGTDVPLGGRCNAPLEDAFISLLGALFSFNDQGDIFSKIGGWANLKWHPRRTDTGDRKSHPLRFSAI